MSARLRTLPAATKALVAVLIAAIAVLGFSAPAMAAPTVDVTVNVTTKGGAVVPGLTVLAFPVSHHAIVGEPTTAVALGGRKYRLDDLEAGQDYALFFDGPGSATASFDQFYGGTTWVEDAKYLNWSADATLDVALASNSVVSGKVTGAKNKPLGGVSVIPYRFDGNGFYPLEDSIARTNSAGVYTLRNLEPGSYKLQFAPDNLSGYVGEFSGNAPLADDAVSYLVGLGSATTSNANLALGGSISGTVRLVDPMYPTYRIPASGMMACAFPVSGGVIDPNDWYCGRATGSNGKWSVPGLPAGDYKVKIYDLEYIFVDRWAGPSGGGDTVGAPGVATYHVNAGKATAAPGTTVIEYDENYPNELRVSVRDAGGDPLGDDATLLILPRDGADFSYLGPAGDAGLYFSHVDAGDYDVWVDPGDEISQPYIDVRTMTPSPGGDYWSIDLAPLSSTFTYDSTASIGETATAVGTTYAVNPGETSLDDGAGDDADVHYSFMWLRDDVPIFGAYSDDYDTYTSIGADEGHRLSVIVRADAFGFDPVFSLVTAADPVTPGVASVPDSNIPEISAPTNAKPGAVLTAVPNAWTVPGTTFRYEWLRDGTPIAGATGRTYTLQPADAGHSITLNVTGTKPGHTTDPPVLAYNHVPVGYLAAPVQTKVAAPKATTIAGGFLRLQAAPGTWSPTPAAFQYTWLADGAVIGTGATFDCEIAVEADCAAGAITLSITATRPGHSPGSALLVARKGTAPLVQADAAEVVVQSMGDLPITTGGQAQVGHVLRAVPQQYAYPSSSTVALAYQWQRQSGATFANIPGATKATYTVGTADVNKALRVRVTVTSPLYPTGVATADAGTGSLKLDLVNGLQPMVNLLGSDLAGVTKLAEVVGSWSVPGVTLSYQWYRCDPAIDDCSITFGSRWVAVAGAKSATFVPPAAQFDDTRIMVRVTGSKPGFAPYTFQSGVFPILSTTDPNTAYMLKMAQFSGGVVSGQAAVGRALTVTPAVLDRTAGVTRTSWWEVCDDASCNVASTIPGAAATTYTPTGDLLADGDPHWIRFRQTIIVNGFSNIVVNSLALPLVPGTWAPTKAPSVAAVPAGSSTYVVSPGVWPSTGPTGIAYQWHENLSPTDTDADYEAVSALTPVYVDVTVTRTGYQPLTYRLVARKGVLSAPALGLTGSALGDTLQLTTPLSFPVNSPAASVSYQWYSGTTPITGAKSATFTPTAAHVGKALKLRISFTSAFYTSPPPFFSSTVVLAKHPAPTGSVSLVSTPNTFTPGAKLTANTSSFGSGFTFTSKWERSPDGISGWTTIGTASSYVLKLTDIDQAVRVTVTSVRAGWLPGTATSPALVMNGFGPAQLTAPYELGGSARIDTPLSAVPSLDATGMTLRYSWTRNGVEIPGATAATLTPTASWLGDELRATVVATKTGWYPATFHSNVVVVQPSVIAPTAPASSLTITPAKPKAGQAITVSPGSWSVGGLTLTYSWYLASDTTRTTELSGNSATYTPSTAGSYRVYVEASRTGYPDGEVSRLVTVTP